MRDAPNQPLHLNAAAFRLVTVPSFTCRRGRCAVLFGGRGEELRMGVECLLFSYLAGLAPLAYGLYIAIVGKVYLSSRHKEPIRGDKARLLGLLTVLVGIGFYAVITWAWSYYDR